MSGSGLAAVHTAANGGASPELAAALASITTTAQLVAAFPTLCAALQTEGAAGERQRILGIQANAMAGHEQLVATMIADPTVTPDMAAGRILAAERTARGAQLQAIVDVETHTNRVAAAPAAAAPIAPAPAAAAATPEGWATEFAAATPAGEKLRGEFASKEDYLAFKANESKVRILGAHR